MLRVKRVIHQPGSINISGFKHAVVQLIVASIILNKPIKIDNIPNITDPKVLGEIIQFCGGNVVLQDKELHIDARSMTTFDIPKDLSQLIHGSLYLIPAYLSRFGRVRFRKAGGCQIGSISDDQSRPIHHLLDVLTKFGAIFEQSNDCLEGYCSHFQPTDIDILKYSDDLHSPNGPLVSGATKTAILCALAVDHGETRIFNPYSKPDVLELLSFARDHGYNVHYENQCIRISPLLSNFANMNVDTFKLMSCVSEVMTFITLSVHTAIPLELTGITVERVKQGLKAELQLLEEIGVQLEWGQDTLFIPKVKQVKGLDIVVTSTGIYSDHQPFFTIMLTHAQSLSTIKERVWQDRFDYIRGLKLMGANIIQEERGTIKIYPSKLRIPRQTVVANDLRAAAALLLGTMTVPGETVIKNVHHLERGYESLLPTLEKLGAEFEVIT